MVLPGEAPVGFEGLYAGEDGLLFASSRVIHGGNAVAMQGEEERRRRGEEEKKKMIHPSIVSKSSKRGGADGTDRTDW